jgi:hypothetical protein
MTQAGQALINASILGPVLVFAGWLVLWLLRKLVEVQDARVADQKAVVDRVVMVVQKHAEVTQHLGDTMVVNTTAIEAVSGAVDRNTRVVDDLHKHLLQRGGE